MEITVSGNCRTGRKGVAVACALAAILAGQLFGTSANQGGPVSDLIVASGREGVVPGWEDALSSDQRSAVEKAYGESVSSGYQGTKDEWLSSQVRYREEADGRFTFVLPDGVELEADPDELFSQRVDFQAN